MTYQWRGFQNGLAEIYGITADTEEQVVLDIPEKIEGYTVTRLMAGLPGGRIDSLTIPANTEMVGESLFENCRIGILDYRAADAETTELDSFSPFAGAKIRDLEFGDTVEKAPAYMFSKAVIQQEELVLEVPYIESGAFRDASFKTLKLSDKIRHLDKWAFEGADI